MESWLLISNCNTFGLGRSLQLLSNSFQLDYIDVWEFQKNIEKYKEKIPTYDRVVINPDADRAYDFSTVEKLSRIPTLDFDAYHPDICYVFADNARLHGPTGAYHSMIVLAAHDLGFSVEQTQKLFRRDVFERSGFFARWEIARDRLLKLFTFYGLDISDPFRRWSRGECFMYGLGHPKARPIHDIARIFIEHCGIKTDRSDIVPHDTLVEGVCIPVYPEVGEVYGVKGSYLFKVHGEYKLIPLEKFIEQSFATYMKYEPGEVATDYGFRDRYHHIKNTIVEAAAW